MKQIPTAIPQTTSNYLYVINMNRDFLSRRIRISTETIPKAKPSFALWHKMFVCGLIFATWL